MSLEALPKPSMVPTVSGVSRAQKRQTMKDTGEDRN